MTTYTLSLVSENGADGSITDNYFYDISVKLEGDSHFSEGRVLVSVVDYDFVIKSNLCMANISDILKFIDDEVNRTKATCAAAIFDNGCLTFSTST